MYPPRLDYIDFELINRVVANFERHCERFLENEKIGAHKSPQVSYARAYSMYEDLACYRYALGFPFPEIRELVHKALTWLERVFELRGTTLGPLVTNIDSEGNRSVEPRKPAYEFTNSADGLKGMYLAVIIGGIDRAVPLAQMVYDPPNADYIGTDSDICTLDQQHLAYSVRNLILNDELSIAPQLDLISPECKSDIAFQSTMIQAILDKQPAIFKNALNDLLNWHRKAAMQKLNRDFPEYFFCRPALALCVIGIEKDLIKKHELPNNMYLPLDLLEGKLMH